MQSILQSRGFYCKPKDKNILTQLIKNKYANQRKQIPDDAIIEIHHEFYAPIKSTHLTYKKNKPNQMILQIHGQFFNQENLGIISTNESSVIGLLNKTVNQHFPDVKIEDYESQNQSEKDANSLYLSTVIVQTKKRSYTGKAIEKNPNISVIKAYIHAINYAYINCHFRTNELTDQH